MAWPTRTWTVNGWEDFKTPGKGKPDSSFPDDWKQHKSSVDNSNYWDVINDPLYEAAANASGIDWDEFVSKSFAEIGDEAEYGSNEYVRVQTRAGWRTTKKEGGFRFIEPEFEVMTRQEAYAEGYTDEDIAAGSGEPVYQDGQHTIDQSDSDLRNWGIDRVKLGWVAENLDTMHGWLTKTIKTHSLQDMPIVDRGPQGSDYGIDGDIWAHYGLDKPPKPPKTMDVNYEFNLLTARPSSATYATPEGFPVLDKSTESVPYGSTHYAQWSAQKEQESQAAQTEYNTTSYGEPT